MGPLFKLWVQLCGEGGVLVPAHLLLLIFRAFVCHVCSQLTDQAWLSKDVKVPFLQVPFSVKGRFHFVPPAELKVVGSYLLGTCIRPEINVDIAVTMPRVSLAMSPPK